MLRSFLTRYKDSNDPSSQSHSGYLDVDIEPRDLIPARDHSSSNSYPERASPTARDTSASSTISFFRRIIGGFRPDMASAERTREKVFRNATGYPTLTDVAELIKDGKVKNLIIMVSLPSNHRGIDRVRSGIR